MVDVSDLQKVAALNGERDMIGRALTAFDQGGRIIGVTIGNPNPDNNPAPPWEYTSQISTEYMQYPQQMVDAIKSFLHQREEQIDSELQGLGVTGIQPVPRSGRRK
jgi:hypothetical protein